MILKFWGHEFLKFDLQTYLFGIENFTFFIACEVTEVKSGRKKPCQFPFTHGGETFYHCTDKVGKGKLPGVPFHGITSQYS